jgi:cobalt/nickel transport system permease protein/cobalt/nickel transport protein
MRRRRVITVGGFVVAGVGVALALAFFVAPHASSSPDGLERVAIDQGFADRAEDSATAAGPLADYAVAGVDDERLSTGLAGVVGVVVTFAVAIGLTLFLRMVRRRRAEVTA